MKNYVQRGDVVTVAAPTGGVASGDGVLIGALFGVATTSALQGAEVELATRGVFDLTKVLAEEWTAGAEVYWDAAEKRCTSDGDGNPIVGVALAATVNPSPTGRVRLNGVFGMPSIAALAALDARVEAIENE